MDAIMECDESGLRKALYLKAPEIETEDKQNKFCLSSVLVAGEGFEPWHIQVKPLCGNALMGH